MSGYVTTKLHGTSTCRGNNNAIFSDRTIVTFPTVAVLKSYAVGYNAIGVYRWILTKL